jgi:hypothetical protein
MEKQALNRHLLKMAIGGLTIHDLGYAKTLVLKVCVVMMSIGYYLNG